MQTEPGAESPPDITAAPRRGRRWPNVVLVLLLLVAVGAAVSLGMVAADQRDAAAAWQDRAVALEVQRDEVADDAVRLGEQLDRAVASLRTSEADVATLEDRVRALAEEKARAEDTASTVAVERDVLIELTTVVSDAAGALDSCVTRLFALQEDSVEAFNAAAADRQVDVASLNQRAEEVTAFCDQARTAAAEAEAAAAQLRRS